jgi:hypothetical protein
MHLIVINVVSQQIAHSAARGAGMIGWSIKLSVGERGERFQRLSQ